ncbi:glycosyltransferase [Qipengyuania sp. ASV99]|uniref:glycosyltransferase n=1 Tax=Qipengyuania sp. ASV99 TaxID=3399681 RepID=UPI003A4C589E
MILVTVGMQLGFDRLIRAMDAIAPTLGMEVIAQTGKGSFTPQNMTARERIGAEEFDRLAEQAQLIVSHAGIGTVLTAQRLSTPIVLLPRRFEYREHRNDHQVATVTNLEGRAGILVALRDEDLPHAIEQGLAMGTVTPALSPSTQQLHAAIARYIDGGEI